MRDQGTPGDLPDDSIHLKQALLDLVVEDHDGLWSIAELDRALRPAGEQQPEHHIEDLVADLYAAGLVHRVGEFAFATRAAAEAERIAG